MQKAGCARITLLTKAFDMLLAKIAAKPARVTPSILQTLAEAADCLGILLKSDEAGSGEAALRAKVLAVDDDTVCNHVIVNTLKRANLDITSVEDPFEGLKLLQANRYDLVLLDIDMPKLTGFEVCEKLRSLPQYKTTPVIFVTAHSNFGNRTQGVLSGGNYFITKPVDPLELALKVTIHLFKAQVQHAGAASPEIKPAAKPEVKPKAAAAPEAPPNHRFRFKPISKRAATAPPTARPKAGIPPVQHRPKLSLDQARLRKWCSNLRRRHPNPHRHWPKCHPRHSNPLLRSSSAHPGPAMATVRRKARQRRLR